MRTSGNKRHSLPFWLGLCLFLAISAFYLWTEHRAHFLGALPWIILLLCPIIHLFMHHGHGKQESDSNITVKGHEHGGIS